MRKITIPILDVYALISGFYIGVQEGMGNDVSPPKEHLLKYGPVELSLITSQALLRLGNKLSKFQIRGMKRGLETGNLEIQKDNSNVRYGNLSEKQKESIKPKIMESLKNLESITENQKYLRPTLFFGTRIAAETTVAYIAGRLYSQF